MQPRILARTTVRSTTGQPVEVVLLDDGNLGFTRPGFTYYATTAIARVLSPRCGGFAVGSSDGNTFSIDSRTMAQVRRWLADLPAAARSGELHTRHEVTEFRRRPHHGGTHRRIAMHDAGFLCPHAKRLIRAFAIDLDDLCPVHFAERAREVVAAIAQAVACAEQSNGDAHELAGRDDLFLDSDGVIRRRRQLPEGR